MRGSTTPSKSTSSQGVHAHGLPLTFHPSIPFGGQTPFVAVQRELTFGPPPNEAICYMSIWYANVVYHQKPMGAGNARDPAAPVLLFIKRQRTRGLWSPCIILSMGGIIGFRFCVVSIEGYAQGKGVRGREALED